MSAKDTNGTTALFKASQKGHTEVVKLLLDKGADVNVKATIINAHFTAIKIAKKLGLKDFVGLLKMAGAKE